MSAMGRHRAGFSTFFAGDQGLTAKPAKCNTHGLERCAVTSRSAWIAVEAVFITPKIRADSTYFANVIKHGGWYGGDPSPGPVPQKFKSGDELAP